MKMMNLVHLIVASYKNNQKKKKVRIRSAMTKDKFKNIKHVYYVYYFQKFQIKTKYIY